MDSRLSDESIAYQEFLQTGVPPLTSMSLQALRNRTDLIYAKVNEKLIGSFKGVEHERIVKVDDQTNIPVTIYTPIDAKKDKLVIFFHGGGWVFCNRKTHQTIVNMLADASKLIWISVEYRLAPEYKFPIWLDDACTVTKYILEHKTEFGGEETSQIGVAGDSAGGFISASLSRSLTNIDFQILFYPILDCFRRLPSSKEFDHIKYGLSEDMLQWMNSFVFRSNTDATDDRLTILEQKADKSLPKCLFIAAELDLLRDDSYKYRELLETAGVETKLILIKGSLHSFMSYPGIFKKSCQQAIEAVQAFLQSF